MLVSLRPLGRFALPLVLATTVAAQPTATPTVRVRLFGGPTLGTATLEAVDAPVILRVDGRPVVTLAPGETVSVDRSSGGRVNVEGSLPEGRLNERGALLEADAGAGGAVRVRGGRYDRRYRGVLHLTQASATRLQIVNHVPMVDYVASVTAHEYPFTEIEGVKAQAVLARTYALQRAQPSRAWDLDDHQGSQVYEGVGAETAVSREATRATLGQVLRYGGEYIEAVYSSSSGGHTAANETVWGTAPVPYLRSRPDPYDAGAPDHAWTVTLDASRVLGALSARYGSVTDAAVVETSPEGRAVRVRLSGARSQTISGNDFRAAVNARLGGRAIRSTHFSLSRLGSQFVVSGHGFGHGVGMSQYGARGQARAGRSYTDILGFYFAGAQLDALPYATGAAPSLPSDPGGPALASASLPREPVPIVRGTWGPPRDTPTPRAVARAAEAEAAIRAAAEATAATSDATALTPAPRRSAW